MTDQPRPGPPPTDHDHGRRDQPDEPTGAGATRRGFLRDAGLGAAALLGGGLAGRLATPASAADPGPGDTTLRGLAVYDAGAPGGGTALGTGTAPGHYGDDVQPPPQLGAQALDDVTVPPTAAAASQRYEIDVVETTAAVADGVTMAQWTYGGRCPGPVLRATEGDELAVTVRNRTTHPHNLHLHGRHAPAMDGWEPIPPGAEFTYEVVAAPAGLHPYHCHTRPLAKHVAKGLYGAMIVDPLPARPPAHEFVLALGGLDVDGDGRNELYAYNGVAGFFARHPITVPVGELVRLYLLNMVEFEPMASFHLHAQTFDVYRSGTATTPDEHTDTVAMAQGQRAVVEFRLPEKGRYMFHPHQHHMAAAGAMGWLAAV